MEPLEDYYEKIRFSLANPDSPYVFDVQKSTFEANQDFFNRVSKNMRKL
jgi:hypothetical protein